MTRLLWPAVLGALSLSALAKADTYWVDYEATTGLFPEEKGWTRYTMYGGGQRWFEHGALVLDTHRYAGICDWVAMERPGTVDPGPGETFVMEWRLSVDVVDPPGHYDVGVGLFSDDAWGVGFEFGVDFVRSDIENRVLAVFPPYVFHDFQLVSENMRDYVLNMDGEWLASGVFVHVCGPSEINWGDGVQGVTSLTRWEWFRFGSVPSTHAADTNCDGTIDFRDINPFVLALSNPGAYQDAYPTCRPSNSDINGDGTVDFGDINPFVRLLTAG
jgi:hypothetical protein